MISQATPWVHPVLSVTPEVDERLRKEARRALREGRERCGFLLGEKTDDIIRVYWVTEPGEKADMTPGHCEPDYVHAAVEKQRLAKHHERVDFVGGWHIHLGYGDRLSSGDVQTLRRVFPRHPHFVALLIDAPTVQNMSFSAYVLEKQHPTLCSYRVEPMIPKTRGEQERQIHEEVMSELFERTQSIMPHPFLAQKRVLTVGLGSGGSTVVKYLGRAGLFHWTLIDPETLEEANLSRHEGFPKDVGRKKVDVVADILKAFSPAMQIETLDFDVRTDAERLRELIVGHDLVLACAGDPRVNTLMNGMALETKIPTVFAGAFPKAIGGYVLQVIAGKTACLNCLYDITKDATSFDSNEIVRDTSRRYGLSEDELRAQQGIYIDIGFIALLQAKMALLTLLRGAKHDIGDWKGNLVLWNSHDLWVRLVNLERRADCSVCNPEGWIRSKQSVS